MYAIIKSGSRQYQVRPTDVIEVNRLNLDEGAAFETDNVLLLDEEGHDVRVGAPFVAGAMVTGTVLRHIRGRKVLIFKHKRRKNYRRTRGHRQELTVLRIDAIGAAAKAGAKPKAAVESKAAKAEGTPAAAAETQAPAKPKAAAKSADKSAAAATKAAAKPKTDAKSAAKPGSVEKTAAADKGEE